MPFTESQPINIHDLAIEVPKTMESESWFYPLSDLTAEDLSRIGDLTHENSEDYPVKFQSILGITPRKSPEMRKSLQDEVKIYNQEEGFEGNAMSPKVSLSLMGYKTQLTPTESQASQKILESELMSLQSASEYMDWSVIAEWFGIFLDLKYFNLLGAQDKHIPVKNPFQMTERQYLYTAAIAKLLGQTTHITPATQDAMKSHLNAFRTAGNYLDVASLASAMTIMSAKEISFNEGSIDLSYERKLNTTPPMPEVRKF